ncbi:hypothetical protein DPSP01_000509 [Paraphaeosphaeria sporulosa]|uniref:Vacuolar protein sorting-associated protein 62 n=1 Tax=Paraphaeosphaeria sporulosa TaxID=1460663 RepID=A0A177CA69_9PLEO|nr:uncharacterized protein CC84DRAFT_1177602 [Paraphaeosphaeria sporulosa]OAG03620.1 hypothetical protein CC84DRAFT_1177602 [Paraphaeosphaeria sporulosa]
MPEPSDSTTAAVPQYIRDHAPIIRLFSSDTYRPASPAATLANTRPQIARRDIAFPTAPLTLANLDQLNNVGARGGEDVYLTSTADVTTQPTWLRGIQPSASGDEKTCAVIVVDKGNGVVDAFYMYFWAFNWGGVVLGNQLGDHVGDWEHNLVRFEHGVPTAMWFSQHANGEAFAWGTVLKDGATGTRPVVYAANGSHALYATPGTHDHTLPNLNLPTPLLLVDETDPGPLYDPLLSAYYYAYTPSSRSFTPLAPTPDAPTGWLYYKGRWGDEEYPKDDKRQHDLLGNKKFVGGPTGPADKQLDRKEMWPENQFSKGQKVRKSLGVGWSCKEWVGKVKLQCFGRKKKGGRGVRRVKVSGEVVG